MLFLIKSYTIKKKRTSEAPNLNPHLPLKSDLLYINRRNKSILFFNSRQGKEKKRNLNQYFFFLIKNDQRLRKGLFFLERRKNLDFQLHKIGRNTYLMTK